VAYYVSAERRLHILDGDLTTGGHRSGSGRGQASEFPPGWSDDEIIDAIEDVANDPTSLRMPASSGRFKMIGKRKSVVIVVIVAGGSEIITGHPW
jgi:hypothetical protein